MRAAAQVKGDFKEIVLSARQDDFFRKHMSSNFGDFALAASELLVEVAQQKKGNAKFSSLQVGRIEPSSVQDAVTEMHLQIPAGALMSAHQRRFCRLCLSLRCRSCCVALQDMRAFLDNYREFSATEFNASKHAVLASELQRLEAARSLMQVPAHAALLLAHAIMTCQTTRCSSVQLTCIPQSWRTASLSNIPASRIPILHRVWPY